MNKYLQIGVGSSSFGAGGAWTLCSIIICCIIIGCICCICCICIGCICIIGGGGPGGPGWPCGGPPGGGPWDIRDLGLLLGLGLLSGLCLMARQLDSSIYYSPKLESEEFLDILALNARELHFHFHFGKQFFNSSKPDRFLSLWPSVFTATWAF